MKKLLAVIEKRIEATSWNVSDEHLCRLGKWYYSDGRQYEGLAEYQNLADPHHRIHRIANECVAAFRAGDAKRARILYEDGLKASHEVIDCIEKLALAAIRAAAN